MELSNKNIDELIDNSFTTKNIDNNKTNYNLILFTDGAHERVKKRSSFGIYIQCLNKDNYLYIHNETKIIKKISKDYIIYNLDKNYLKYHSIFNNISNDKCEFANCTYFANYSFNKNENGKYCKLHKDNNMIQTMTFINYEPTNIRAEGWAITYALIYLKFILIDKIHNNELVTKFNTFQINNNKFEFKEYNIPNNTSNYTFYQIVTDSEFWINVITSWCNNWIKKNIIFDKKNLDIVYYINVLLNELLLNNIIIHFKFVRGHSDKKKIKLTKYEKGNIIADKLANIAKENINTNIKISFT